MKTSLPKQWFLKRIAGVWLGSVPIFVGLFGSLPQRTHTDTDTKKLLATFPLLNCKEFVVVVVHHLFRLVTVIPCALTLNMCSECDMRMLCVCTSHFCSQKATKHEQWTHSTQFCSFYSRALRQRRCIVRFTASFWYEGLFLLRFLLLVCVLTTLYLPKTKSAHTRRQTFARKNIQNKGEKIGFFSTLDESKFCRDIRRTKRNRREFWFEYLYVVSFQTHCLWARCGGARHPLHEIWGNFICFGNYTLWVGLSHGATWHQIFPIFVGTEQC